MNVFKFLNAGIFTGLAGFTMLAVPSANADQFEDTGFYLGAAYGMYKAEDSDFEDENGFPKVFAGFQILPFLGVEAAYQDFGRYGEGAVNAETDAWSVLLTGRLPLTSTFALFAEVGPMWWETNLDIGPYSGQYDGRELMAGVGASFQLAENIDLRASYEWVDVDLESDNLSTNPDDFDSDLRMVSVGVKFEF